MLPKKEVIIDTLASAYKIIQSLGDDFSFKEFERRMFGYTIPDYDKKDVYATYHAKITQLNKEGRIGSAEIYRNSRVYACPEAELQGSDMLCIQ